MHVAAGRPNTLLVGCAMKIEMRERVVLDVACRIAQRIEFRQAVDRRLTPIDEAESAAEHALQLRIGNRGPGVLLERRRGDGERHGLACASWTGVSPIGGASVMPARTSATWRTAIGLPSRCNLPAMFIRQPRSPASSVSAPVATMCSVFLPTITLEIAGYLTQKVPPNPQQTSDSRISSSRNPPTVASSLRGCALTPSSRRPEQES